MFSAAIGWFVLQIVVMLVFLVICLAIGYAVDSAINKQEGQQTFTATWMTYAIALPLYGVFIYYTWRLSTYFRRQNEPMYGQPYPQQAYI